jgi:lysophospholipase L1-like esterase
MNSKILFVGDSITHGTNWSDRIDFAEVENIAVPGFSTDDVSKQLFAIAESKVTTISLLIGTNDFGNPEINRSGEEVGNRVTAIIGEILNVRKDVEIVVNSILPRALVFTDRIEKANRLIASYFNDRVHFLDCWPTLSFGNELRPEFLLDDGFDVHLNETGYDAWARILIPALRQSLAMSSET